MVVESRSCGAQEVRPVCIWPVVTLVNAYVASEMCALYSVFIKIHQTVYFTIWKLYLNKK